MIRKILLVGIFLQGLCSGFSQQLFNNDFSFYNPAFVGMYDKNNITSATSEFSYKDWIYDSEGRIALNMPIKKIFSGIGIHATYNKAGISSNLDLGAIYSFKYNIGKDFSVAVGSNFSLHRFCLKGEFALFDFSSTIDNMSNYETEYVNKKIYLFNFDFGFWLRFKNFQLGVTNQHVNNPSQEFPLGTDAVKVKLNSNMNAILSYDLFIGQKHKLKNSLLISDLKGFARDKSFILNNLFEINNIYLIGLTTNIFKSDKRRVYLSPNIGFNLAERFRFLMAVNLIKINTINTKGKTIEGVLTYNF